MHHRQRPVAGGHARMAGQRHECGRPPRRTGQRRPPPRRATSRSMTVRTSDASNGGRATLPPSSAAAFPEDVDLVDGVVGLHQRAHAADGVGRKTRARLVGGAAVVGHAQQHRAGAGVGAAPGAKSATGSRKKGVWPWRRYSAAGCWLMRPSSPVARARARAASAQASAVAKSRGCKGRPKCTVASTTRRAAGAR